MSTIKIKRSQLTAVPATLAEGELAFSEVSGSLFIGKSGGNIEAIAGSTFAKLDSPEFSGTPQAPTPLTSDNSQKIATTAFVKSQNFMTQNQTITVTGDATGSGTTALDITLANTGVIQGQYTKVSVDAKGRVTDGTNLIANDIPILTSAKISDFDAQVRTSRLDQFAAPTADVDFNNRKITGLAAPTQVSDAATKQYVDEVAQGLTVKAAVDAATTGNILLNSEQTIDGVTVTAGMRVLVKDQTDATENGIYEVKADAWIRASDADNTPMAEVCSGLFAFVTGGTVNGTTTWVISTPNSATYSVMGKPAIELGVQNITFTQFSGAGSTVAGAGLAQTGNVFNVGAGTGIAVEADAVKIDPAWTGQTAISTVGTITTGTWNGNAVDVAHGGTGVSTLTGLVKGNGTTAFSAAVAGTDYLAPSSEIDGGTF